MKMSDTLNQAQPETIAGVTSAGVGGVEAFENSCLVLRGDTRAIVSQLQS